MRVFLTFILVILIKGISVAQEPDSTSTPVTVYDNFDFTEITTTDFMQGDGANGVVNWGQSIMIQKLKCELYLAAALQSMLTEAGLSSVFNTIRFIVQWLNCGGNQSTGGDEEPGTGEEPGGGGSDPNWPPSAPEETGGWGTPPPMPPEYWGGATVLNDPPVGNPPTNWGNDDEDETDNPQEPTGIFTGLPDSLQIQLQIDSSLINLPQDTLKPIRVHCPDTTAASIMGVTLNKIWDSIKNSDTMQVLMEGLHRRRFEVGFRVQVSSSGIYATRGLDTNGRQRNVQMTTTPNTVMWVHSHAEKDSANKACEHSPSPADIFALGNAWRNDWEPPRRLHYMANISGDADTSTFALAITDSAKLMNFLSNYPADSSVDILGTNNWKGNKKKSNTLLGKFWQAYGKFKREKYERKELENYANVYMAQKLDIGITFYKKIDGVFKAMAFKEETDSQNRKRYKITICE